MTPAQKAFEKLQSGEWVDDEGIEAIRKALQGVDEKDKEIQRLHGQIFLKDDYKMCSEQWIKQYKDEIKVLKSKSQILLKALQEIIDRLDKYTTQQPWEPKYIAQKAISDFNSDETGVGL